MESSIPYLGATGFVPAPVASGFEWSLAKIVLLVLALAGLGYGIYYFFFKPLEAKELEPSESETSSVVAMNVRFVA